MAKRIVPAQRFGKHSLDKFIRRGHRDVPSERWVVGSLFFKNLTEARNAAAKINNRSFNPDAASTEVEYAVSHGHSRTAKLTLSAVLNPLKFDDPDEGKIEIMEPEQVVPERKMKFNLSINYDERTVVVIKSDDKDTIEEFLDLFA